MKIKNKMEIGMLFILVFFSFAGQSSGQEKGTREKDTPEKGARAQETTKQNSNSSTQNFEFYLKRALQNPDLLAEVKAAIDFAKAQQYRADWAGGPKIKSTTLFSFVPANADTDNFSNNFDEIGSLNLGPYLRQSFKLGVPLYTFGRIRIAQKLAKLGVDVAKLKSNQAKDQIAFQTVQAYYGLQTANTLSALLLEGAKIIKKELNKEEEAREFGDSKMKIKDFRKLQIFNAEVDARINEANKLAAIAKAGLSFLSGEKNTNVGELDIRQDPASLLEIEAYLKLSKTNRPEIEMLRRAEHGVKLAKDLAGRNWYPNIALVSEFSFGLSTENIANTEICRMVRGECVATRDLYARPLNGLNFSSFTVGLAMQWEFDYWQNRGKSMEAEASAIRVSAQKKRALGAIEMEIRKLYEDAKEAFIRVGITKRRLTAARRWRDQFGLKVQSAGGDISDAVEPLKAFFEARALHLKAHMDYRVARAALHRAVGLRK